MPVLANSIIFIRTAAWVFPFSALCLFIPGLRQFNVMLVFWVGGLAGSMILLSWRLRRWPWREILSRPFAVQRLVGHFRKAWLIYCSDLGLVSLQYVDRFVVNALLGLSVTGVYTFYWSLANAAQVLVYTG